MVKGKTLSNSHLTFWVDSRLDSLNLLSHQKKIFLPFCNSGHIQGGFRWKLQDLQFSEHHQFRLVDSWEPLKISTIRFRHVKEHDKDYLGSNFQVIISHSFFTAIISKLLTNIRTNVIWAEFLRYTIPTIPLSRLLFLPWK